MDILFKNSHLRNKEMAKEVYGYYYFKRLSYVIADIIAGAAFIFGIVQLILNKNIIFPLLIIPPLLYLAQFMMYYQTVSILAKRNKAEDGKTAVEVITEVTDNSVKYITSEDNSDELELSNAKYAAQTKNFILLFTQVGLIFIFRKDAFSVGTKESFLEFLRSKNIPVK